MNKLPRVPDSELDFESDLVFTHNGVAFTGIAFEDDAIRGLSEITYRDGMQEGPSRDWYPSGQLRAESTYRENVLHGHSREYDRAGNLTLEAWHEYGILVRSREFDEAGQLLQENEIDPQGETFRLLELYRRQRSWPTGQG